MSIKRARALRKNETESEKRVWRGLRLLRREGLHFRRQAPIGDHYVDFVCHRAKIVIELDGLHHATPEQMRCDAERTKFLESVGYRVIRFWNVEANADSIAQQIRLLIGPPPPTPPLVGGGE
jgi:very-short-patch-repair endonuclease